MHLVVLKVTSIMTSIIVKVLPETMLGPLLKHAQIVPFGLKKSAHAIRLVFGKPPFV